MVILGELSDREKFSGIGPNFGFPVEMKRFIEIVSRYFF